MVAAAPMGSLGQWGLALGGVGSLAGGIGSIYGGIKQADMANKQFALQKDDYYYNRKKEEDRLAKLGDFGSGMYGSSSTTTTAV